MYFLALILFLLNLFQTGLKPANISPNFINPTATVSVNNPVSSADIPLTNASSRILLKPFGIKVSPANSPVQPEKFSGYHTGTDFEILPSELNTEVDVKAICDGKVLVKREAQGYGGVLVQSCTLSNEAVTVIYGHLKLSVIRAQVGDQLSRGEKFALLGDAYSAETGGERKHLHLGIHVGTAVDLSGYVQQAADLKNWLDYQKLTLNS